MSTRSTLTVRSQTSKINFYRHMDGYVGGAGKDLYGVLYLIQTQQETNLLPSFIYGIANLKYKNNNRVYEFIDSPLLHADREYHYTVTIINNDINIRIEEFTLGKAIGKAFFDGSMEKFESYLIEEKII